VVATLLIIVLGKSVAAFLIVLAFRQTSRRRSCKSSISPWIRWTLMICATSSATSEGLYPTKTCWLS
jgi:hypothetical protein